MQLCVFIPCYFGIIRFPFEVALKMANKKNWSGSARYTVDEVNDNDISNRMMLDKLQR